MGLADRMRDYAGRAPTWRPNPGEWIVGVFEGFHVATAAISGEVRVATIRVLTSSPDPPSPPSQAYAYEECGRRIALWFLHAVLAEEFTRQQIEVGDQVGVKYLGKKSGNDAKSREYHLWHVEVDRPGAAAPAPEASGLMAPPPAIPSPLGPANLQPAAATLSPAAQAREARENPRPWSPPGGSPAAPPREPSQATLLLTDDDIPF
jgi:hypothetical protein